MSIIDSGHCEVGYGHEEGRQEAALVGRREAVDLLADARAGCFGGSGCAPLCDEREPDPQLVRNS